MTRRLWAVQAGSYGWAKEAAQAAAADMELAARKLANLTGQAELAARARLVMTMDRYGLGAASALQRLEYRWHYSQSKALREALSVPTKPADRRTVTVAGKPYHYVQILGRLELRPGESPW